MKAQFALDPMHASPFDRPFTPLPRLALASDHHPATGYNVSRSINPVAAAASLIVAASTFASLLYIGGYHHPHHREHRLSVVQLADLQPPPPPPPQAPQKAKPANVVPPEVMAPPPVVTVPTQPGPTIQTTPVVSATAGSARTILPPSIPVAAAPPAPIAGDLSAKLVSATPPSYPLDARRALEQGTVVLSVLVSERGSVSEITVFRSSGSERLDRAALRAVRHWRWSPTIRDGNPVLVQGLVKIPFVLQT